MLTSILATPITDRMSRRGRFAALAAVLVAAVLAPGIAQAGYGVQPIGQTVIVTTSGIGYIVTPGGRFPRLSRRTRLGAVHLGVRLARDQLVGTPAGSRVASCNGTGFTPWVEPGSTSVTDHRADEARAHYWWLDYRRLEEGSAASQKTISGPFAFRLEQAPPPARDDSAGDTAGHAADDSARHRALGPKTPDDPREHEDVALGSDPADAQPVTGERSIKHQRLRTSSTRR